MQVTKLIPEKKVIWLCTDQLLIMPPGLPELSNKREWVGNNIKWNLEEAGAQTKLTLLHEGLNPDAACWHVCEQGWDQSLQSLKSLVETGKGKPFAALDSQHLTSVREAVKR